MKYKIKDDIVWEEIGGKITVLDPEQGKYFVLNKSAGEIWKSIRKPITESKLIEMLCHKYVEEDKIKIILQVKNCLEELSRLKVLKTVN